MSEDYTHTSLNRRCTTKIQGYGRPGIIIYFQPYCVLQKKPWLAFCASPQNICACSNIQYQQSNPLPHLWLFFVNIDQVFTLLDAYNFHFCWIPPWNGLIIPTKIFIYYKNKKGNTSYSTNHNSKSSLTRAVKCYPECESAALKFTMAQIISGFCSNWSGKWNWKVPTAY